MKVLKFGGTSVGTAASIRNVLKIVNGIEGRRLLVLSAMSGVTNMLVQFAEASKTKNKEQISAIISELQLKHFEAIEELLPESVFQQETKDQILSYLEELRSFSIETFSAETEAKITTIGETMLTYIVSRYFSAAGLPNQLLNAKTFMQVSNLENPDTQKVGNLIQQELDQSQDLFITQGFVRLDATGAISTLKRGGSDYTATIIGAALDAEEVQIWTDISGIHNNDPRFVENTHAISELSFEEAAELAYFGAKILHPQTISPVIGKDIPVFLKNTFTPEAAGTCITAEVAQKGLKAISAKDGITAIKIKSNRMLMAHGFLKKIFEIFDKYETAIDMITTSEIAISLTIDDTHNLEAISRELTEYGEISVDSDHSIICVVGEGLIEDRNTSRLFEILQDVPVRMISYGGSKNNISLLVDTRHKVEVLQKLNEKLFVNPQVAMAEI